MTPFAFRGRLVACGLILTALVACGDGVSTALPDDKAGFSGRDEHIPQGGLHAGPELWDDPSLAPHPAYNFATVNHPPAADVAPPLWYPPAAPELPGSFSKLEQVGYDPFVVPRSGGLAVFGSLAVTSGFGDFGTVVDISDPQNPKQLSQITDTNLRGAQIIPYPNGRLIAAFATERDGIPIYDITDPRKPRHLTTLTTSDDYHNIGVVPGTPLLYNAASQGGGLTEDDLPVVGGGFGYTEIFDLSDPDNIVLAETFHNGWSCHDVRFWIDREQDKYRAICAGVEFTQLWDIRDPLAPEVIVSLPVHHGIPGTVATSASPAIFSHFAGLNRDGTILFVGDETGGGGLPPGCVAHAGAPAAQAGGSFPLGALFFYDVSDETDPLLQGWFSPSKAGASPTGSCTVHFGRLVPEPTGRDQLIMGAYSAGTLLIDFTNPSLPYIADQFNGGTTTWEAWYLNGYVVTGDLARGLDVLKVQ